MSDEAIRLWSHRSASYVPVRALQTIRAVDRMTNLAEGICNTENAQPDPLEEKKWPQRRS